MHNSVIADNLGLLSKLIDIHGDDSFKAKSYSSASYTIDKLPVQLASLTHDKIYAVKGIGQTIGKKVIELLETGSLSALEDYFAKTPEGVMEMLKIKGLGPKKISTVWKELGIESIGELLYACEENRLLLYKGFGAKTQENIKDAINFYLSCRGSYLYGQIEDFANRYDELLHKAFPKNKVYITGDFNRHAEVIHKLEWITDVTIDKLKELYAEEEYEVTIEENTITAKGPENVKLQFHSYKNGELINKLFQSNCSETFFEAWKKRFGWSDTDTYSSEEDIFTKHSLPFIPPYYRESTTAIEEAVNNGLPKVITKEDIKGIIHSHSNWSDGSNTIEEMVQGAISKGLEYLVISDHSQTANYAGGLYPDKIKAQHKMIDELNKKYAPFKILKSIESDILNDGSLDYTDDVLASFDLVITSVHSNLKMTQEKAMSRLLKAISNPYTTILGHMTGRMLLSRNGYPVDYDEIIEACKQHNVVIELNAHSRRLDMDWRQIPKAVQKGILISIDPDAHAVDAFEDIKYGVLVAQKAGLIASNNLSSFSLVELEAFLEKQRAKRK